MGSNGIPANESEEKKKKKFLIPIIIILSVLLLGGTAGLLAGLGVFKGGETESETEAETEVETSTEEEPDYSGVQLWWNVDRMLYAGQSEIGTSSRQPNKDDGYYHVLFASDGRQVSRRVASKKVLNVIDGNDLMGLVFDENGIVVDVVSVEELTGGFAISGWYISDINEETHTLTVNSAINLEGIDVDYEIPTDAKIYDVSGVLNYVGMPIAFGDLKKNDKVFAVKDKEGKIVSLYITDRYVKPEFYWNVERKYDSELLSTTRTPNENGEYEILMATNGEQVLLKTKDRTVATNIDKQAAKCVSLGFDAEGYINKVTTAGTAGGGGTFASWYRIQDLKDGHITAMEASVTAAAFGTIQEGDMTDDCRCYDVSTTAEFVGKEIFDLRVSDQIHGIKDANGRVFLIYVVSRKVDEAKLFWNMVRKYDSKTQNTTRTKSADGYYHIEMAADGTTRDLKTKDISIVNQIDSYAAKTLGLALDGNVITKVYAASLVNNGQSFASWYYVTSVKDGVVTAQLNDPKKGGAPGTIREAKLSPTAQIINVSGIYATRKGEFTNLMANDKIQGWTNYRGEIEVIYVHGRTYPDKTMYCPICGKDVKHAAVSGAFTAQKDAAGKTLPLSHYYVPQNLQLSAQGTTPYTSTTSGSKTSYFNASNVHLNLNGKTVTAADEKRMFAQFGSGQEMYIFDTAAKKGTLKSSGGAPNANGTVFWTMSGNSKLVVKDITIDLSNLTPGLNYGPFLNNNSTSTWEFDNCKIIGSKTPTTGGSIFSTAGTLTLRDTEVICGASKDFGAVYLQSSSAKLYLEGNTKISGGTFTDGTRRNIYLPKGALIYTTDGLTCEDGSIYVTTAEEGAFTSTGFEGLASKFVADTEGGVITEEGGKLYMKYIISGLKFDLENAEVEVGSATKMAAKTTPVNSSSVKITYTSSDPESVLVNADGTIVGVKETAAPVTVTAKATVDGETYEATVEVTVKAATKPLDHYHVEGTAEEIASGTGAKINFQPWEKTNTLPTDGGYYYLTADVQLTSQFNMAANEVLHLCLNGHKIIGKQGDEATRTIALFNDGCELSVCDCSEGEKGQIVPTYAMGGTSGTNQGRAVWLRYGTFNFYSGEILGAPCSYAGSGSVAQGGGAVYVGFDTTFNMYGGTIRDGIAVDTSGTTSPNSGGGNVGVTGTMNMYGGTIKDGIGGHGGNIHIRTGKFNMYGGTVSGGYAGYEKNDAGEIVPRTITDPSTGKTTTWRCGGNIYVASGSGRINIYGGVVENGHAQGQGGNIFVAAVDGMKIQGTEDAPVIIRNGTALKSSGGNIAQDVSYSYTIENAEVSGGVCNSYGANIYDGGVSMTLKNVKVSGGKAGSSGSVYIGNGTATLENVVITATELPATADPSCNGLVLGKSTKDPVVTIKDSEISTVRLAAVDAITLDGKCVFGTSEIPGYVLTYKSCGDRTTLADGFSSDSKISVFATDAWTVASNGASKIDCFTQLLGDSYELAADGAKLILQSSDTGKHKHCVCGTGSIKVGSHTCADQIWTEWTDTKTLPTTSGYYFLANDVQLTGQFNLAENQQLFLCLNGHTVKGYSGSGRAIALFNTGCELNICDCSEDEKGTIYAATSASSQNTMGRGIWVRYGTFNLYGGTIVGSETTYAGSSTSAMGGGTVYVPKGATFNMYGGTLKGGQALDTSVTTSPSSGGGNVGVAGTMNMYGGVIEDGIGGHGGNVYIRGGALNMYGGVIRNGYAGYEKNASGEIILKNIVDTAGKVQTWRCGGNIYISKADGTAFNMYGGEISGGHAQGAGGNIFVAAIDGMNVKGTEDAPCIIKDGTTEKSYGGNIASDTSYSFSAEYAKITGGTSAKAGANIYACGPATTLKNVTISGGESKTNSQVYISNGTVLLDNVTLEDAVIPASSGALLSGLVLEQGSGKTLTVTVKNSKISKIYNIGATSLTLDGTNEIPVLHLSDAKITLGSTFAVRTGAPISVRMKTAGQFTTNEGAVEDFRAYDSTLHVEKNADGTLSLTLGQVPEVTLDSATLSLYVGTESGVLTATPNELAESFQTATWTSTDETVAKVEKDASNPLKATVTRLKEGTAVIKVTLQLESDAVSAECEVECLSDSFHKHCVCCGQFEDGEELSETLTHTEELAEWTPWTKTNALPGYDDLEVGDNYFYLTADVKLTSNYQPGKKSGGYVTDMEGRNIIICLNGHNITTSSRFISTLVDYTNNVATHVKNLSITITDCCETQGTITWSNEAFGANQGYFLWAAGEHTVMNLYGGIVDAEGHTITANGGLVSLAAKDCEFNLFGGTMKAPSATTASGSNRYGMGVYIGSNGVFNMYGGEITGGTLTGDTTWSVGGNVYLNSADSVMNMYGGTISKGTATHGGNIALEKGTLNIYGGTVTEGTATKQYGGNIMSNAGTVNIYDGLITKGKAQTYGGNISISGSSPTSCATLNISGGSIADGTVHSGNKNNTFGGNIYSAGKFTLTGGKVSGGSAKENVSAAKSATGAATQGNGGNIYIGGGTFEMSGDDTLVTGGNGALNGGNITFVAEKAANPVTAVISGGTISNGYSWSGGAVALTQKSGATLNVTVKGNVKIVNNTVSTTGYASGILVTSGNLTVEGTPYFADNKNTVLASDIFNNTSSTTKTISLDGYTGTTKIKLAMGKSDASPLTGTFSTGTTWTTETAANYVEAGSANQTIQVTGGNISIIAK